MLKSKDESYLIGKRLIWLYVFLLVFEGALRKWVFPSFATPLLVVREPIVVLLVIWGMHKKMLDFIYVKVMLIVSTLSLVFTLLFGHHNILVGLFGWRIYFFHFPMIFMIGQLLDRDDILKICKFLLYLSIPMTIIVLIQFYSSPTAWVNIGVGGEGTAGFGGANGYMRPPGLFSFTAGYILYQGIVGCALLYYLLINSTLKKELKIPHFLLIIMLLCYLIAIPTSISRTNLFQSTLFLFFFLLIAVFRQDARKPIFTGIFVGGFFLLLLYTSGLFTENIDAFSARFDGASKVEGGLEGTLGNRYFGGFMRAFLKVDVPLWGYGVGIGTNVGSKFLGGNIYSFGFDGEIEWERIIGECGYILGLIIIAIRFIFSFKMLVKSFQKLLYQADILPWMLAANMIISLPQGQWMTPTNLGFSVLSAGLTLASIRTSKQVLNN